MNSGFTAITASGSEPKFHVQGILVGIELESVELPELLFLWQVEVLIGSHEVSSDALVKHKRKVSATHMRTRVDSFSISLEVFL